MPSERGGNSLEQALLLARDTAPEAKHLGETTGRLCHLTEVFLLQHTLSP